ncbi:hypothetical protein TNCV_1800051 [Trichonephila clavipes]|nr:hypothetical protein TNCV_1800051 [Trichonephila clavipes]
MGVDRRKPVGTYPCRFAIGQQAACQLDREVHSGSARGDDRQGLPFLCRLPFKWSEEEWGPFAEKMGCFDFRWMNIEQNDV